MKLKINKIWGKDAIDAAILTYKYTYKIHLKGG